MSPLTWDQYMVPHLEVLADGQVWRRGKLIEATAIAAGISDEERTVILNSGQPRYINRASWALSYLKRAGAVSSATRGDYEQKYQAPMPAILGRH